MMNARVSSLAGGVPEAPSSHETIPFAIVTDDGVSLAEPAPRVEPLPQRSGALRAVARLALRGVTGLRPRSQRTARALPPDRERVAPFERALAAAPDDLHLWRSLQSVYTSGGDPEASRQACAELLDAFRRRGDVDAFAACCRRLDRLGAPGGVERYKELAALYAAASRHEDAAHACRQALYLMLDEGHNGSAVRFINNLPSLGAETVRVRSELRRMLERAMEFEVIEPEPVEEHAPPVASEEPTVVLAGRFGAVSLFDVVHVLEQSAVTGRIEVETASGSGSLALSRGRIVAARHGDETGIDAAKRLVRADRGAFRAVLDEEAVDDELHAESNTGLLMRVLCAIDEEDAEAKRAAAGVPRLTALEGPTSAERHDGGVL